MSGESAELVPIDSDAPIPAALVESRAVTPVAPSISPALVLARLHPYRVIDTGKKTIYYFLKIGAKEGTVSERNLPPEVARQVAMITVDRAKGTFTFAWYPWADQSQIVTELPVSQVGQAVSDLLAAGFK